MWGLIFKNLERIKRLWIQTLIPPLITTVLYIVVFGFSLGRTIPSMNEVSYLKFIIPGLMMMAVITNAYSNVTSSFFTARLQRWIEETLVAPISNAELIVAFTVGGIMRGILVGLMVFITGFFIADISVDNWFLFSVLLLLTSTMFALAGFLNALVAKTFDGISFVPNFILTPLTFLGGVFYSASILPGIWQQITLLNPVFWIISGFRESFYGVSEVSILYPFIFLILMIIGLFAASLHFVNKGLNLRN